VVGVIGDSGTAGQDNCYFDGWMPTFERVMSPLFAAMGKKLVMRNAGRNGGLGASWSLACLDTMVGSEIDALMVAFHGVGFGRGFDGSAEAAMEATLLRALNRRQVVFSDTKTFAHGLTKQYNEYGVTSGTSGLKWQPEGRHQQDDPFWGSLGDGRCHTTSTRSGSSAVWFRNWHAGPLGHSTRADMYAIRWLDLVVAACGQFLTHGAAAISKQPAVPEPVASGKGMWQASAPVCITTEGPAFNKDAYGSLQGVTVKWSSTRSGDGRHKCAAGDKKCVADPSRSANDCKHLDVYTTPFAPVTTIVDPSSNELWKSIHTVVLCQPDEQNAGSVKQHRLHSGEDTIDCSVKTEKDQAGQVMDCHYCVVSEVAKFQSQPFHWEGASINYIFGIH